jgi:hypothetical protein
MSHHAPKFRFPAVFRPVVFLLVATLPWLGCADAREPLGPVAVDAGPADAKAPTPPAGLVLGAPVFGLDVAPDGSLLAAAASSGLTAVRKGSVELLASLPGASGVAAIGTGEAWVVTEGADDPAALLPTSRKLYRAY